MPNEAKSSSKKSILVIIILLIAIICGIMFGIYFFKSETTPDVKPITSNKAPEAFVDNPIDFNYLKSKNDEIYAWLKVEGTNVDHPIVQSVTDDSFYLKHDAYDKSWLDRGAIYTESLNNKDFKDQVTVIYGHNGYDDTMFTTLHNFEDKEFFDSHPYFYIYTPEKRFTYQIISAFKYDNRHIINTGRFNVGNNLENFQKMIQNPESTEKIVRDKLDVNITIKNRIVILSTCITNQKSNRYLVCGVLVKDERTK